MEPSADFFFLWQENLYFELLTNYPFTGARFFLLVLPCKQGSVIDMNTIKFSFSTKLSVQYFYLIVDKLKSMEQEGKVKS